MSRKGLGKFIIGAGIGAGLGLLFAPKKGSQTRKELKEKLDDLLAKAKEIDVDEVKENIELRVKQLQKELKDLDKEKVLTVVKTKATEIGKKAEELVIIAKEKATPVVLDAAKDVKKQAAKLLKEAANKLEK